MGVSPGSISSLKPLTSKQISFCDHYIRNGFNGKAAAISAGYAPSVALHAEKIINSPAISSALTKAINKNNQNILDKLGVSYNWRVEKLKTIIDGVISNGDAEEIRWPYVKQALTAIAELNKMGGDYAPDKSLRLNVDMTKDKMQEVRKAYSDY